MKQVKENGVNKLTNEQESMRMQVVEMEMKARYWKAQFDIKYYTLESNKLEETYMKFVEEQRVKEQEAFERFKQQLEKDMVKEQPIEEPKEELVDEHK